MVYFHSALKSKYPTPKKERKRGKITHLLPSEHWVNPKSCGDMDEGHHIILIIRIRESHGFHIKIPQIGPIEGHAPA